MPRPRKKPAPKPRDPAQKSDQELIAEALKEGKVTKCPPGEAQGALKWWVGTKNR